MSKAWPLVKLGEVIRQRKEFITIDDTQEYMRCRVQLHAKGIVLRDRVTGSEIKTKQQQVCQAGEFLVAEIDAKVGGFGIVPDDLENSIVSSHYFLFTLDHSQLNKKFLDYYSRTPAFREQVNAKGSTNYAAIRPHEVLNYTIPLPPLAEQQRIVAKIERLAGKIEEAKEIKKRSHIDISSLMSSILGEIYEESISAADKVKRLESICNQITDGTHHTPTYVPSGIPFLSVKDITSGQIKFDNTKFITIEEHNQLIKRCKPEYEDVLLTKVGTTGFAKAIDVKQEFSIFVSLALLKVKKDIMLPSFLEHMLNSSHIQEQSKAGTRGVGNKNLVLKFIKEFPIPVPPLEKQKQLIKKISILKQQVSHLKHIQAHTTAELDAMLPSILDQAFKGQL